MVQNNSNFHIKDKCIKYFPWFKNFSVFMSFWFAVIKTFYYLTIQWINRILWLLAFLFDTQLVSQYENILQTNDFLKLFYWMNKKNVISLELIGLFFVLILNFNAPVILKNRNITRNGDCTLLLRVYAFCL